MPMDTVDCWRIDGIARRTIFNDVDMSNSLVALPSKDERTRKSTMKERQADSPCAISVAQAAPAMPM